MRTASSARRIRRRTSPSRQPSGRSTTCGSMSAIRTVAGRHPGNRLHRHDHQSATNADRAERCDLHDRRRQQRVCGSRDRQSDGRRRDDRRRFGDHGGDQVDHRQRLHRRLDFALHWPFAGHRAPGSGRRHRASRKRCGAGAHDEPVAAGRYARRLPIGRRPASRQHKWRRLQSTQFVITNLESQGALALTGSNTVADRLHGRRLRLVCRSQSCRSPTAGQMDLLTVVTHELGHILGLADVSATQLPNDLMDTTLPTGVRLLPRRPTWRPWRRRRHLLLRQQHGPTSRSSTQRLKKYSCSTALRARMRLRTKQSVNSSSPTLRQILHTARMILLSE